MSIHIVKSDFYSVVIYNNKIVLQGDELDWRSFFEDVLGIKVFETRVGSSKTPPKDLQKDFNLTVSLIINSEPGIEEPLEAFSRTRLIELVRKADYLRKCQKEYMADRGNEALGKKVGEAAAAYDALREEINA